MLTAQDPFYLERFIEAQSGNLVNSSYETALHEIRDNHRKSSHWMWYVFPQLKLLGHSWYSQFYGIVSLGEARAYLQEPLLYSRLIEISTCLLQIDPSLGITEIMGSPDNRKLQSSMTLYHYADSSIDVFSQILERFYCGTECQKTCDFLIGRR